MPSYSVNFQTWSSVAPGTKPWTNPSNAEFTDNQYATAGSPILVATQYLQGTNPTSISPGANEILSSITVSVTRHCTVAVSGGMNDFSMCLVKAGTIMTGVDLASASAWPVNTDGTATYTWTAANLATLGIGLSDVQNSGFGVALSVIANQTGVGGFVDSMITSTIQTQYTIYTGGMVMLPPYATSDMRISL